jgi:hypothetical protein
MDKRIFIYILVTIYFTLWSTGLCAQEEPLPASSASQQQSNITELTNAPTQIGGTQSIVFPSSKPIRSYSIPGESPLPPSLPIPAHFAPPVTDGNFGNLFIMLTYKDQFSMGDAEALLEDHGKMRILTSCYLPDDRREKKEFLRILPDPKDKEAFKKTYELIGIGNYKALDGNSISEQILGIAIKEGLEIGADVILFQEGAALMQTAKGYSIGISNSFSFTNSGSSNTGLGNVSVGGLGFGKGESMYVGKPWLRVQFFREQANVAVSSVNRTIGSEQNETSQKKETDGQPRPEDTYIMNQRQVETH